MARIKFLRRNRGQNAAKPVHDPNAPVALPKSRAVMQFGLDMFLVHSRGPWHGSPYRGIAGFLNTVEYDPMGAVTSVARYAHIKRPLAGPRQFAVDIVVTCVDRDFPWKELNRALKTLKTGPNARVTWVTIWVTSEHYPTGVVRLLPPTPLNKVDVDLLPTIIPMWYTGLYDALADTTGRFDRNDGQPVSVALGGKNIMFLPLQFIAAAILEFGAHLATLGGGNVYSLMVVIGAGANESGAGGNVEDVRAAFEELGESTVYYPAKAKYAAVFAGADRIGVYAGEYNSGSGYYGQTGLAAFRQTCRRLGMDPDEVMVGLDGEKLLSMTITASTRLEQSAPARAAEVAADQVGAKSRLLVASEDEGEDE